MAFPDAVDDASPEVATTPDRDPLLLALVGCGGGGPSAGKYSAPTSAPTSNPGPVASIGADDCVDVQSLVHTARTVDGPDLDAEFEHYLGNLVDDISEAQDNNEPTATRLLEAVQRDVESAADAGSKGGDVKSAVARLVRDAHAAGCRIPRF